MAKIPGQAILAITGEGSKEVQTDPALLQQDIFRFCDEFSSRMSYQFDQLLRLTPDFQDSKLIRLKLAINYRMMEIAAGQNDYVNLCDLVCLVSLANHSLKDNPVVHASGETGAQTLNLMQEFEYQVYKLAGNSLGDAARERLREKISVWLEKSYVPGMALYTHYTGLSSEIVQESGGGRRGQSSTLLGALMLDPLAGLDPTVREIAKSRLFAERAMYVAQRMPRLIRMEGELAAYRLLEAPETAKLLADIGTVTNSIDRITRMVEELPGAIQAERKAVTQALEDQTPELTRLMTETRATLEASTEAVTATNTLVQSTDQMFGRLGVYNKPAGSPPDAATPPTEPFRIKDYTEAATQLARTAEQLNTLVASIDQTLASAASDAVAGRLDATVDRGRDLVDHAFWRAVLFVALCCVMVLATVLACRLTKK